MKKKNYIHIKGEITTDIVREIYYKLSSYINEDDDEEENNDKKEMIRKLRKAKSSVLTGIDRSKFFKQKNAVSSFGENLLGKKGKEQNNNNENDKKSIPENGDEKNTIIKSVFIEKIENLDLKFFLN